VTKALVNGSQARIRKNKKNGVTIKRPMLLHLYMYVLFKTATTKKGVKIFGFTTTKKKDNVSDEETGNSL